MSETCAVVGCPKPARVRGHCNGHYKRLLRYGDPNKRQRIEYGSCPTCTVPGCGKPHIARGLCGNHYALLKRNGKPETVREFTGSYIKDGYRYILVSYRHYEPEHRIVMERHLGRKLAADEHVHHKDENTLNNAIGNLEVLTRAAHMATHRTKVNAASAATRRRLGSQRGERNDRAILTDAQVIEIRACHATGQVTQAVLAKQYGVSVDTIRAVVLRRRWTHV